MDNSQTSLLEEEEFYLLSGAALLLVEQEEEWEERPQRKKREIWQHHWMRDRSKLGWYHKLMKYFRQGDRKRFRNFVRMDPDVFDLFCSQGIHCSF